MHEWNTAVHVQEREADAAKRAPRPNCMPSSLTAMTRWRASGPSVARAGFPPFGDATLFKTAYAFGLRRDETRMLDAAGFGRNPHGTEFGEYAPVRPDHGRR